MASFSAGTTFVDGVANDVTAAKLAALVNAATPTSGLIQDRTAETAIAVNDNLLVSDASDSNNLKRMTVANFRSAATFGTTTSTAATITTGTIATLNSTTGTITTGVIPTLTSITKITSGTGTAAAPAISPTGDTNTGIFFPTADTVAFAEGGAEVMRIDSAGNVGIGRSDPSSKLQIYGTGSTASNPSTSASLGATLNIQDSGGAIGNGGMLMLGVFAGNFAAIKGYFTDGGSNTRGNLLFCTRTNATDTALTEKMRIDSSGNVGIGATSPSELLEVGDSSTSDNYIQVSAANNTASGIKFRSDSSLTIGYDIGYEGNGNYFFFKNDVGGTVTEQMRINSSGNVGIGNTSPTAKLDVSGSFNATSGTIATFNSTTGTIATFNSTTGTIATLNSTTGTIATLNSTTGTIPTLVATTLITTGTGTAAAPAIVPTGDTNTGIFFPAADTIAFTEGATEAMRINSSGNVSIGTATALSKLHVHGDLTMSNATTAVTASTSTITPPATVAGYLTVSINGTSRKIAYYAT